MSKRSTRRAFMATAGTLPLGLWLSSFVQAQEGVPGPRRFLFMLRPNGTIRSRWVPTATADSFTLPAITSAFEPIRDHMVILDGINLVNSNGGGPTHEGGMNTLLTGSPVDGLRQGGGPNDWRNSAASIDQILLSESQVLGTHSPLYVAADGRVDNSQPQVANRAIAYTGPDEPIYPELKPTLVYARLFSGLMPGGSTADNEHALLLARQRKQSVLDFMKDDLNALYAQTPLASRPQLDQHLVVIRELEQMLDVPVGDPNNCSVPNEPSAVEPNRDENLPTLGEQHLALIQAAFACDLTRVAYFMWSAAASSAKWEDLYPGMPAVNHHATSHEELSAEEVMDILGAIDHFYAEKTAAFLSSLASTPEGTNGTLLDNTLVVYTSEVADGTHSYTNLPIALFGGPGVGLEGGRFLKVGGRSMNDLWLAILNQFGVPRTSLGAPEQYSGVLQGVFS